MLPYSKEAERSLLYCIIAEPEAIKKVIEYIEPTDFYDVKHGMVYKAIIELWDLTDKVDLVQVSEILENKGELKKVGGMEALAEFTNSEYSSSSHIIKYAKIIKENSLRRKLIAFTEESKKSANTKGNELGEILNLADNNLMRVQREWQKSFAEEGMDFDRAFEKVVMRREPSSKGFYTGINIFDEKTFRLKKGHYWIGYGFTGSGKSFTALTLARKAMQEGARVRFISLEMAGEELWDRLIRIEANGDNGDTTAFDRVAKYRFIVEDKIRDMSSISRYVKQHAHETDLFVVDYMGLIRLASSMKEMEKLVLVSDELAFLAKNNNVCILCLAQTNMEALTADDWHVCIRGGAQVIAPADVVFRIKRATTTKPDAYGYTTYMKFVLQKNRHGASMLEEMKPICTNTGIIKI